MANTDYLFVASGSNVQLPYKVDSLLYDYTSEQISTRMPLNSGNGEVGDDTFYYIEISSSSLKYESVTDVDNIAGAVSYDSKSTKRKAALVHQTTVTANVNTCLSANASGSSNIEILPNSNLEQSSIFEGDVYKNDIFVDISKNIESNAIKQVKKEIITSITNRVSAFNDKFAKTNSVKVGDSNFYSNMSHTDYNDYLTDIHIAIGSIYLKKVYEKLEANEQEVVNTYPDSDLKKAEKLGKDKENNRIRLSSIKNLGVIKNPYKFEPLLQDIRKVCKDRLYFLIQNKTGKYEPSDIANAFVSRHKMAKGEKKGFYYLLRTILIDYYDIDSKIIYEDDPLVYVFMKKLLIDLYIKCCYPLIQYDLIDSLLAYYTDKGDFVNARFALLAKILFTYHVVKELSTNIKDSSNPNDTYELPNEIKNIFPNVISQYIKRNNKGDINSNATSTENRLIEIIKELRLLSNDVISASDKKKIYREAIANNQLTLRNTAAAIEQNRAKVNIRYIEFYILVSILFSMIIACGVLYFLNLIDIGMLVAAGVLISIIIFVLIRMIISFIMKN